MTFKEWYASLTTDDKYVFNLDGAGFPRDPQEMMGKAYKAAYRAGMERALALSYDICRDCHEDLDAAICAELEKAKP